jgi:hypothetical protein
MVLFIFGFGIYGYGIYLAELQRLRGWPNALISSASTLSYLPGSVLAVYSNDILVWMGPKAPRFARDISARRGNIVVSVRGITQTTDLRGLRVFGIWPTEGLDRISQSRLESIARPAYFSLSPTTRRKRHGTLESCQLQNGTANLAEMQEMPLRLEVHLERLRASFP